MSNQAALSCHEIVGDLIRINHHTQGDYRKMKQTIPSLPEEFALVTHMQTMTADMTAELVTNDGYLPVPTAPQAGRGPIYEQFKNLATPFRAGNAFDLYHFCESRTILIRRCYEQAIHFSGNQVTIKLASHLREQVERLTQTIRRIHGNRMGIMF